MDRASNDQSQEHDPKRLQAMVEFLREWSPLIEASLVNIFLLDLSPLLPQPWIEFLSKERNASFASYVETLTFPESYRQVGIQQFVDKARELRLDRKLRPYHFSSQDKSCDHQSNVRDELIENHWLKLNLTPKKRHEVSQMTRVVGDVCRAANCKTVIDVGSGEGYLSTALAACYGLDVFGLDCSDSNVQGASARAGRIARGIAQTDAKRQRESNKPQNKRGVVRNLSYVLNAQTSEIDILTAIINNFPDFLNHDVQPTTSQHLNDVHNQNGGDVNSNPNTSSDDNRKADSHIQSFPPYVLIGLHACGGLTNCIMRLYLESNRAQALVVVGCCYYRLATKTQLADGTAEYEVAGHPLSTPFLSLGYGLGSPGLSVACDSLAEYFRLSDDEREFSTKTAFFRSLLSIYLDRRGLNARKDFHLRGMNPDKAVNFNTYMTFSLEKLCKQWSQYRELLQPKESEIEELFEAYIGKYEFLKNFLFLRTILSEVCESFIALDRVLHLREQIQRHQSQSLNQNSNHKVQLVPIFEQSVSPRNLALISLKTDSAL